MHRYVALIASSESEDSFDRLSCRLSSRFADWRCALDGRRVKAWVKAEPPTPIGFTSQGPSGCLIGVELGDRRPAPWDRVAGNGLLSRSWGAYVSIQVGDRTDVTITRDPSGRIPCWTSRLTGADLYFSHIDDVPELLNSRDPIDWDYIQYHLSVFNTHGSQSGLKAIAELLPGRQMRYSGGPGAERSAWPIADVIAAPFESPAAAETGLRAAVAEAVGGWARRYDRIELDLSGGFDSAVVLGLIREQAPDARVLGVNYLIAHPEGDERAYAQAAADHHGVPLMVEPLSAEGRRFELGRARHWLRPNTRALPGAVTEARARAASTIDAQAAFSGTGGDHVFGQSVPPSVIAEAVQDRLPLSALLNLSHDYAKMSADTFLNIGWVTIKELWGPRRALRAILQAPNSYLTPDAMESTKFERFAHPEVFELSELTSSAKLRQILSFHELNNQYWRYGKDFEPDEVNPLQSQLVLEASLRIPSYWMNPAGRRRGLARRAFHDLIPEMILTRRGKSGSTSQTIQILANNIPFLRELMLDGQLVRRGLLDKKKLESDLCPARLSTKIDFSGLVRSIASEIWVQSFVSLSVSSAQDYRIEFLAPTGDWRESV